MTKRTDNSFAADRLNSSRASPGHEAGSGWQRWLVILAGLLCAATYLDLALISTSFGEATLTDWLPGFVLVSLTTLSLFAASHGRLALKWFDVLLFAILFRLIALLGYPVLEDDHFRYLWDGWMTLNHGSPYGIAPALYFGEALSPEVFEDVLDNINYPHVATVYGPTAQWLFAGSYLLAPGSVAPMQLIAVLADLGIVLLLKRMVTLRWVLLYAWSGLMLKEFAFTAHIDVVGAFLLLLAIYLSQRQYAVASMPWLTSIIIGGVLALAVGVKAFCLLAVPFLLQVDWRGWLSFLFSAVIVALPFGIVQAWWPAGLQTMGSEWIFNAPLYIAAVELWGWDSLPIVKGFAATALAATAVTLYIKGCGPLLPQIQNLLRLNVEKRPPADYLQALMWLFGVMLLASPVLNPWYLVWWLVLASLSPAATPWVCSFVLALSYVTGLNTGDARLELYQQPDWIIWIEFGAIGAAVIWDIGRACGWTFRRPAD